MLPQQVLMLQVAARALDAVALPTPLATNWRLHRPRSRSQHDNFHFRWSQPPELRDARAALNANRTMGALAASPQAASLVSSIRRPSFTIAAEECSGIALLRSQCERCKTANSITPSSAPSIWPATCEPCWRRMLIDHTPTLGNVSAKGSAFVLKRLADAMRDGDTIHASSRTSHNTDPVEYVESRKKRGRPRRHRRGVGFSIASQACLHWKSRSCDRDATSQDIGCTIGSKTGVPVSIVSH